MTRHGGRGPLLTCPGPRTQSAAQAPIPIQHPAAISSAPTSAPTSTHLLDEFVVEERNRQVSQEPAHLALVTAGGILLQAGGVVRCGVKGGVGGGWVRGRGPVHARPVPT